MVLREIYATLKHVKDYPNGMMDGSTYIIPNKSIITTPLILVHGFISNVSIWNAVEERFRKLGWTRIYKYNYNVFRKDIRYLADEFSLYMDDILEAYEYDVEVNFIGHSLGGIVIRDWLSRSGNHIWCNKVITLGSPHQGSRVAHVARFIPLKIRHVGKALTPGSEFMKELNSRGQPPGVKFYAINACKDELVLPRKYAEYPEGWKNVTHVYIDKIGHIYLAYAHESTLLCHGFLTDTIR